MHPILMKIGPLNIYSYGVMVAVGFIVVAFLAYRRAPKFGLDGGKIIDCLTIILISGIAGARLLYIALNSDYYIANPSEILNLSKGGLVWYGGLVAVLLASIWFTKNKMLDFWEVTDFMSPYMALGQAFGRIGCYLNGCCYGIMMSCGSFQGVRHPTQIYSAILLFVIFAVMIRWQNRRRFKGEIFLGYIILCSYERFFIEFLRGDNPKIFLELTISQLISLAAFLSALYIFKRRADKWERRVHSGSK